MTGLLTKKKYMTFVLGLTKETKTPLFRFYLRYYFKSYLRTNVTI